MSPLPFLGAFPFHCEPFWTLSSFLAGSFVALYTPWSFFQLPYNSQDYEDFNKNSEIVKKLRNFKSKIEETEKKLKDIEDTLNEVERSLTE